MWHTPRFPGRILFSPGDRGPTGSRRSSHRRRSASFRLERLEERSLLSTLTVSNGHDSGPGSLRQAIAHAAPGDTIVFKDVRRITLTSGELAIDKSLDIEGPGACRLTISGNDLSRIFDISPNTKVTIAGLTIANGKADGSLPQALHPSEGGGILNLGKLTLDHDVLLNNQAIGATDFPVEGFNGGARGGAVTNYSTLDVTHCQFIHNQAQGADENTAGNVAGLGGGGGIANGGSARIEYSWFVDNVAQGGSDGSGGPFIGLGYGGAISNSDTLDVTDSRFCHNQALGGNDNVGSIVTGVGAGGAIGSGRPGGVVPSVMVSGCTFDLNQAVGGNGNTATASPGPLLDPDIGVGGAIAITQGSCELEDSTFRHNQALGGQGAANSNGGIGSGGGIAGTAVLSSAVNIQVTNCTVDYNAAIGGPGGSGGNGGDGLGGGIYEDAASSLTLTGATVKYNRALGGQGGSKGSDGQGIGGGVYANPLGTFTHDASTVIKRNHASTSNDNIFPSS